MKYVFTLCIFCIILTSVRGQNVTIIDTPYTQQGNPEGIWGGTLYIPSSGNGIGVLVVHGSGVFRETSYLWCDTLAANGYTVFTIDYPMPPDYKYPKAQRSIKLAIEFMRRNALGFGITTGKIMGIGFSFGAAVLGQVMIWDNDDAFFQTDPTIDDHLNAAALFYGYYSYEQYYSGSWSGEFPNETYYERGSCIKHIANITTPILLLHGTGDLFVNYMQSVLMDDTLVSSNKISKLILYPNLNHGFDLNWPTLTAFTSAGLDAKDSLIAFFRDNSVTSVNQESLDNTLLSKYILYQNYPNPFNPSTRIKYTVANQENVLLRVYDILGNEVETLINMEQEPGVYEIVLKSNKLASGIYFYQLTSGEFNQTKKMIVIK